MTVNVLNGGRLTASASMASIEIRGDWDPTEERFTRLRETNAFRPEGAW